jgi:hypothetical protein
MENFRAEVAMPEILPDLILILRAKISRAQAQSPPDAIT